MFQAAGALARPRKVQDFFRLLANPVRRDGATSAVSLGHVPAGPKRPTTTNENNPTARARTAPRRATGTATVHVVRMRIHLKLAYVHPLHRLSHQTADAKDPVRPRWGTSGNLD